MKQKRNMIAMSKQPPAKIYMACIRETPSGKFEVWAKYGRFDTRPLNNQRWFTTESLHQAHVYQERMFKAKLQKGFRDIEAEDYSGAINRSDLTVELEKEVAIGAIPAEVLAGAPNPVESTCSDDIVTCTNNIGIEDKFDAGVEYIYEKHPDRQMIYVHDKNGVKGEFFSDRFEVHRVPSEPFEFKPIEPGTQIRFIGDPLKPVPAMKHFK